MCTVTFIARRTGYALGMNRDEKLARAQGLPPTRHRFRDRAALFPSEPGGGTWIGINDAGVTFALINWYSAAARVPGHAISRGQVVPAVLPFDAAHLVDRRWLTYPLDATNPFRLIAFFHSDQLVIEWRWNRSCLERIEHPWQTNIWISSGFDEHAAQRMRRRTFELAVCDGTPHDLEWLRRLHAGHAPAPSACSICMHRADAATVSYTEVDVSVSQARVSYRPGPPCCPASPVVVHEMRRRISTPGLLCV